MKTKFMCFLLVFLLLVPTVSTVFAATTSKDQITANGGIQYYDKAGAKITNSPTLGGNSIVSVSKSIKETDTENEFLISLGVSTSVDISEVKTSSDAAVVLVLDTSGSMAGHIASLKTSAINFVDSFASEAGNSKRYVALVTFATTATIQTEWVEVTNAANLSALKTKINSLTATGSTNIEGGLQLARNLFRTDVVPKGIKGDTIESRSVILFSDGETNVSSNTATAAYAAGTIINYKSGVSHYATSEAMANVVKNQTSFAVSGTNYQKYDAYLYTIAFGSGADTNWLKNTIATNSSYAYTAANAKDLNDVFAAIAKRIESWAEAWTVTDPMGENIEFITNISATDKSSGLLDFSSNTLSWDLKKANPSSFANNIYSYKYEYRIKLDTTKTGFVADKPYNTNGKTDLSYVIVTDGKIDSNVMLAEFSIPAVKGYASDLNFKKIGGDNASLAGCVFQLANKDKATHTLSNTSATGTGAVSFKVPSGQTYTLKETSMPTSLQDKYIQSNEVYTVSVSYGNLTIKDSTGATVNNGFNFVNQLKGAVVTGNAVNILDNSAIIENNTYSNIPGAIDFISVQYSTNSALANPTTTKLTGTPATPYAVSLAGLTPNTTYYYRAYVESANGSYYGEIKSFTTIEKPEVVTGNATDILSDTAKVVSNTYAKIPGTINFVSVQYSTDPALANPTTAKLTGTPATPYNVNLTGLTPNTKYYYRAYVESTAGAYNGEIKSFTTSEKPEVVTGNATNILSDNAKVVTNTYAKIPGTINFVSVQYSTDPAMANPTTVKLTGTPATPYDVSLTGLTPNTKYYYRAYVESTIGAYSGEIKSFSTDEQPEVVTGNATNILFDTAKVAANTYAKIPGTINSISVQFSTNSALTNPTTVKLTGASIATPYDVNLTGLTPNTTYYYRAYVESTIGDYYGAIKSFTTIEKPEVVTGNASAILVDTATIVDNTYAKIPGTIDYIAVQYSTSPTMASPLTARLIGTAIASPYSINLTGLNPDTTYYYRANVESTVGSYFGEIKSFKTLENPEVITGDAIDILEKSATITNNTYSGINGTIDIVAIQYNSSLSMTNAKTALGTIGSPFSVNLTGLEPDTTYYYRAGVRAAGKIHYGTIKSFTTPKAEEPKVITGDAINVLENSATITNNSYSAIPGTISFTAIQYSTTMSLSGAKTAQGTATSPFSVNLTGLEPNTTYYYRAAVSANGKAYYGDVKIFTTPKAQDITVVTGDPIDVLENSATIADNTYSGVTGSIGFVGVQYSTDMSMSGAKTVQGPIGSPYSVDLTGLQPNTTYYYTAIISTGGKYYTGDVKMFTTPKTTDPKVVTGNAVNILEDSAVIEVNTYSNVTGTVNYTIVQYSTTMSLNGVKTAQGTTTNSPFSANLSGLEANTAYYYRAGISVGGKVYYGDVKMFTTPKAQGAKVVTGDPINVLENSATIINNTYSGVNNADIRFVAVQYSTNEYMTSPTTVRGTTSSPYAVDLTGLQPDTTYYYRAGVSTATQNYFGVIKSFTTPATPIPQGKATIVVTHQDEDGVLLQRNTYTVKVGTYGPYNAITIPEHSFVGHLTASDSVTGTIGVNETKTIVFVYKKS